MKPSLLRQAAADYGTPLYVYDVDIVRARFAELDALFGGRFGVSYAVKSNPNIGLLSAIRDCVTTFDVSSYGEMERALSSGCPASDVTFSGPGKRVEEIHRAVRAGLGELVLESVEEAEIANAAAGEFGCKQGALLRINPISVPRRFGVNMAGKPSQFGVDEEDIETAIPRILALPNIDLIGFHIYSGTNSLSHEAIAENFAIFLEVFRKAATLTGRPPQKLVFGSGFGLPYLPTDETLDVAALAAQVIPAIDAFRAEPLMGEAELVLEMGRWLVGPAGWLLTAVIGGKTSRGTTFRICDAGFNNHLAACGMMGTVIRRNWRFANISRPEAEEEVYTLVGPLCTTIDVLASAIALPRLETGDVIAIDYSGAYGLTASPTRFISHPEPREVLLEGSEVRDVTESLLNHWPSTGPMPRQAD
ncbi:MAG: type III PLP-dependent enzyme [Alphaproteobacteria bacterium]|nr:type III PLP-dependent enzyme [Alphaproteobacteria bacterium]MCB9931740.1 type III PLP-dependent enzyme [Alphaproteobacteria bacterium]